MTDVLQGGELHTGASTPGGRSVNSKSGAEWSIHKPNTANIARNARSHEKGVKETQPCSLHRSVKTGQQHGPLAHITAVLTKTGIQTQTRTEGGKLVKTQPASQGERLQMKPHVLTPRSQPSGLQDSETMSFCCFSHPVGDNE